MTHQIACWPPAHDQHTSVENKGNPPLSRLHGAHQPKRKTSAYHDISFEAILAGRLRHSRSVKKYFSSQVFPHFPEFTNDPRHSIDQLAEFLKPVLPLYPYSSTLQFYSL